MKLFDVESTKRFSQDELKEQAQAAHDYYASYLYKDGVLDQDAFNMALRELYLLTERHGNLVSQVTNGRYSKPGTYTNWVVKAVDERHQEHIKECFDELVECVEKDDLLEFRDVKQFFGVRE